MINYYWMDDRLRLALLKENTAYRNFWVQYGGDKVLNADRLMIQYYAENPEPYGHLGTNLDCAPEVEMDKFHRGLWAFKIYVADKEMPHKKELEALLYVLNPYNEELPESLPFCFHEYPPVAQVINFSGDPLEALEGKITPEHGYSVSVDTALNCLQPSQRLIRIDLARGKTAILEDVAHYIDRVAELRKEDVPWAGNYEQWDFFNKRERDETWQALKVWRLRRRKIPFLMIKKETGLSVTAAKAAYYRIYELIEGRRYDKEKFKEFYQKIQAEEQKGEIACASCKELPNCGKTGNYCPDMLALLPDFGPQRESFLHKPLDEVLENYDPDNYEEINRRKILYAAQK